MKPAPCYYEYTGNPVNPLTNMNEIEKNDEGVDLSHALDQQPGSPPPMANLYVKPKRKYPLYAIISAGILVLLIIVQIFLWYRTRNPYLKSKVPIPESGLKIIQRLNKK